MTSLPALHGSRGAGEQGSTGVEEQGRFHPSTPAPMHLCTEGWEAKVSLKEGIARPYAWIEAQVRAARDAS